MLEKSIDNPTIVGYNITVVRTDRKKNTEVKPISKKKKSGKQDKKLKTLNLITAILVIIDKLIDIIERLTR